MGAVHLYSSDRYPLGECSIGVGEVGEGAAGEDVITRDFTCRSTRPLPVERWAGEDVDVESVMPGRTLLLLLDAARPHVRVGHVCGQWLSFGRNRSSRDATEVRERSDVTSPECGCVHRMGVAAEWVT